MSSLFSLSTPNVGVMRLFRTADPWLSMRAFVMIWAISWSNASAEPLFGPRTDYATGPTPFSVAAGDLDGDGATDLVVANGYYISTTVSVLLGNGDGTFRPKSDYQVGLCPLSVAISDLNRDGRLDLAVANANSHSVSILLGNGDGTFAPGTEYFIGGNPFPIAVGDFNGDGIPDLAVANNGSSTVSVMLGRGDGTFSTLPALAAGTDPWSVVVADLNGDGRPDLAVSNDGNPGTVSVLLGNGDGTFGVRSEFGTGIAPIGLSAGDLNGDGHADLMAAAAGGLSILLGLGNGTFLPSADLATGSRPWTVALGDLDRDGHLDAVAADFNTNSISVFPGSGDGTFGASTDFETGANPTSLVIADFNGDGWPDLAVTNQTSNTVSVLLNLGHPPVPPIPATVELVPRVLNASSAGTWITAFVELPPGADLSGIDLSTVRLDGKVPASPKSAILGDHNSNRIPDLMVKFSRQALAYLTVGDHQLALTGALRTGQTFIGYDSLDVIDPLTSSAGALSISLLSPPGTVPVRFSVRDAFPTEHVVRVFDSQGRLVDSWMVEGSELLCARWDGWQSRGGRAASGIYFVNVRTGAREGTLKIVIAR